MLAVAAQCALAHSLLELPLAGADECDGVLASSRVLGVTYIGRAGAPTVRRRKKVCVKKGERSRRRSRLVHTRANHRCMGCSLGVPGTTSTRAKPGQGQRKGSRRRMRPSRPRRLAATLAAALQGCVQPSQGAGGRPQQFCPTAAARTGSCSCAAAVASSARLRAASRQR